jgi:hypothetical protein
MFARFLSPQDKDLVQQGFQGSEHPNTRHLLEVDRHYMFVRKGRPRKEHMK